MPGPEPAIVFEHNDFWVVNKPPGWTVQADNQAPGVLDWFKQTGAQAFPIHRLDKLTSGLLLVGRTVRGNRQLSQAFAERSVQKTYLAISDQKPKKKQGWIKGDMAQARRSQWKLLHSMQNPALTQFYSVSIVPGMRGFMLLPKTGKTHQLRVALKSLGAPILGDTLYGGAAADRMYLHAYSLAFSYNDQPFHFMVEPDGHWFKIWKDHHSYQLAENN
ncbi:MAG: TIGR01621 family pseudouridine synthase [Reinekea sp.]|jgi:tRNA pseudouridine32 synthase / 23S rRNA pseudouridine746 synthase